MVTNKWETATSGQDSHSHLLGIHAFVNVGDQIMMPGSLSAASYWVGLRQEIYSAVITQSPVKMSLDHFIVDRSVELADDYTWANRAVVNLADVLNFCFSDVSPSTSQWTFLNAQCTRWDENRPTSFEPFFFKERVLPSAFPEIWHHSSCHSKLNLDCVHLWCLRTTNLGLLSCWVTTSYTGSAIPNTV